MSSDTTAELQEELRKAEEDIELKSQQMGRLKAEYTMNVNNIKLAYFPKALPYTTAVYQSKVYQEELALHIRWLETKIVLMEQKKNSFLEVRDMDQARRTMMGELLETFEDTFREMETVTKDELAVLRAYDNPPQGVLDTVHAVMIIRGEPEPTWEHSKVLFSETYYYTFFISKARNRHRYGDFTAEQVEVMSKHVISPELEPSRVAVVSRPCGILSKWISLLYKYYMLTTITTPAPAGTTQTIESVKEQLQHRRIELAQKKAEIVGAESTLKSLEEELNERLADLRQRYDDTMLPLQELFFEANRRFNDAYCSPRRERDKGRLEEAERYEP